MKDAKRNPRVYLEDILGAIAQIEKYTSEGKDQFMSDMKTKDAVIRQLSIIGEASVKLPKNVREMSLDTPWKKIIGMRNIIVHDYSHTDLPTIWDTIEQNLPMLKTTVETMLRAIS